ncbi:MAG: STAS domain-containing protein [Ilumatobacteraceae bacterium]
MNTEDSQAAPVLDRMLTVQVVYSKDVARLVALGEIDASSTHTFDAVAHQALTELPTTIEIDLTGVEFIDSSGLRSIVSLVRRAGVRKIEVNVTGVSAAARRVLEITGLIAMLQRG